MSLHPKRFCYLAILLLCGLLAVPLARANTINFSDGTFNPANWTASKVVDTTGGSATFSEAQVLTGGNPGAYRQVTHTFGPGSIGVFNLLNGAVYNPSTQGAIKSLSTSFDLLTVQAAFPGGAVEYNLVLFQNNTFYLGFGADTFAGPWAHFSGSSLTPSSFISSFTTTNQFGNPQFVSFGPGPALPDFSKTGAPIQFGYASLNNSLGGPVLTDISGIDNWSVTVNQVIPEPGSLTLFTTGLILLAGAVRRRVAGR